MNARQTALRFSFAPRYVALFSGGHSSALVAIEAVRRVEREIGACGEDTESARRLARGCVALLNHDINARVEDPDVKRFKREVSDYLGIPITQADHPRVDEWDQFDVVREARAFKVRNGQELCTSRLKTEPFRAWLDTYCPPGGATLLYGFDATEEHRIRRRASILAAMGYESDYPLALWPRTIFSTREIGIEPPLTYGTFKHANCVGCLKAGWQHWFVVYATRPDIWQRAKDAEDFIGYSIHKDAYLSEREEEFAAMVAAGIEPTEHTPSPTFWKEARAAVRRLPVVGEEEARAVPCDCAYRKPGQREYLPCDCWKERAHGHSLACLFTRDEARREAA